MNQYACPKCESENLKVAVLAWAKLTQTRSNMETEVNDPEHEWHDTSAMSCVACGYTDQAKKFK
jgi:predicted nucleic-acid-binding Zn-ribbon protein